MGRRTNVALGVLLCLAVISGLASNAIGVDWAFDLAIVHGLVALAILLLAPWKSVVIRRGLRRRRSGRWTSLLLLGFTVVTLASGLWHAAGTWDHLGPLTMMQLHVGGGVASLVAVSFHFRRHPQKPRRYDLERRAALRGVAVSVGAGFLWLGWERTLAALSLPGIDRRFTGSHERSSGAPESMPVTSWLNDRPPAVDPGAWRLWVGDRAYDLSEFDALPNEEWEAVLDCTGGWYSVQTWTGVRLDRLLPADGEWLSFEVRSATGYARRFPREDAGKVLLALRVGGESLTVGHGFPARLVVPNRRGFWWVKWVTSIQPSTRPWWVQSPFPLT